LALLGARWRLVDPSSVVVDPTLLLLLLLSVCLSIPRLMIAAEHSINALQTAFLSAANKQKTAPGLAGFRVLPQHVTAVCSGFLSHDERLAKAQKKWYCWHMVELYHIYATAKSQACMAVLRLLSEFVVTAEGLLNPSRLLSMHSNRSSRSSTSSLSSSSTRVSFDTATSDDDGGSSSSSTAAKDDEGASNGSSPHSKPSTAAYEKSEEALLALCLHDTDSVLFLVRVGAVRPTVAVAALADNDLWAAALAVATISYTGDSNSLDLGASDLLDLATDAAMSGDATVAWAFLQLGGTLELIIAAVEEDQMVCLTANPMQAFSLARAAGYLAHAVLIYEDFRLAFRLSSEQKVDMMLHAAAGRVRGGPAGCTPGTLIAGILAQEQDAGLSLLQGVVHARHSSIVQCLINASARKCSPRVLKAARMACDVMAQDESPAA
jgi:hypothetical protein